MAHLMEFEQRTNKLHILVWLQPVSTPLIWREWAKVLEGHPDPDFRHYILNGIAHGFRIGFDYKHHQCRSATSNMQSSITNAEVVKEYLDKEVSLWRIISPVPQAQLPVGTQLSPFGVIPKSGQPGR